MTVTVQCKIKKETDAAMLIEIVDMDEPVWLPLSQVDKIVRRPDFDSVTMSDWIAEKKGIE